MSLKEKIEKDFIDAFKRKEARLSILRLLKTAIKNAEIAKRSKGAAEESVLSEEEILFLIRRQLKQLTEAGADFKKGGREDLVRQAEEEAAVMRSYLPSALSEAELVSLVEEAITEIKPSGPQDFGKVMGSAMKKAAGRAEGNAVKEIINKKIRISFYGGGQNNKI